MPNIPRSVKILPATTVAALDSGEKKEVLIKILCQRQGTLNVRPHKICKSVNRAN